MILFTFVRTGSVQGGDLFDVSVHQRLPRHPHRRGDVLDERVFAAEAVDLERGQCQGVCQGPNTIKLFSHTS